MPTGRQARSDRDTATARLLGAYHNQGDARARERLVELYMPLVEALARRHGRRGAEHDDLVQAGSIGLLNAIERFDPKRGEEFVAFAVPTVEGEMKRHIRDRAGPVRLPRRLHEASVRLPRRARRADGKAQPGADPDRARPRGGRIHGGPGRFARRHRRRRRPSRTRRTEGPTSWTRASRDSCLPGPSRASTTPIARSSTCASSANSAGVRWRTSSASRRARSRAARMPLWPRCGPSSRATRSSQGAKPHPRARRPRRNPSPKRRRLPSPRQPPLTAAG